MSGDLQSLKSSLRNKKVKGRNNLALAREAKKAKLSQDVILCTPVTTVQLEPKLFCATCSSQKIIDSNQITINSDYPMTYSDYNHSYLWSNLA
jgi:hypothetical protein